MAVTTAHSAVVTSRDEVEKRDGMSYEEVARWIMAFTIAAAIYFTVHEFLH